MSAYLHRLLAHDPSPSLAPQVRSRSPIAAIDQRLATDESLGHGLGELDLGEPTLDEPMLGEASEPTPRPITVPTPRMDRVGDPPVLHRKSASAPTTAPSPIASSPLAPAPITPSNQPQPIASARSPKLDPGPLFDLSPEPRSFDESRLPELVQPTTAPLARHEPRPAPPRVAPEPIEPEPASRLAPRIEAPTPTIRVDPFELEPTPAPSRPSIPLAPTRSPQLEPRLEPAPRRLPLALAHAELEPLAPIPRPLASPTLAAPAPVQLIQSPQPARAQTNAHEPTRSTPRTPERPSSRPRPRDIESLSQIGPLDRHFPNRRWLRLRYR